jgi:hypothetical protein
MDIDSIPSGTPFRQRIKSALDSCDVALVLVGKRWAAPREGSESNRRIDEEEDFVRLEVAAALARKDVSVVPVLVEGAEIPTTPSELDRLKALQDCKLRNTEWRADIARIFHTIDKADRPQNRIYRRVREVSRRPLVAGLLLALAAVGAVLLLEPTGSRPIGCDNLPVPAEVRGRLSVAAGTHQPATKNSVYYGACGHRAWAVASFPGRDREVFIQSGFHWDDLGSATRQCARVPAELRGEWGEGGEC